MSEHEMKIELMDPNELHPYAKNPRINDGAVDAVAASIKEFGFRQPIVVDADMIIICGHTRWKSALKLGLAKVPVHIARDLTADQIKAYRIADNKTGELAEWNYDLLPLELVDLQEADFDLSLLGFDESELDKLLNGDMEDVLMEGETEPDAVQEVPETADSRRSQVYRLGDHLLMCGDATDAADVAKLMGETEADLWLTDPPYNVNYEGGSGLTIQNDNMSDAKFREFLRSAFDNAKEHMKPGAGFYIFHADSEGYNFRGACHDIGLMVRQCLIWKKNALVLGRQDFQWIHEPILYGWKDGAAHRWYNDRAQTTVIEYNKPKQNDVHPCLAPDTFVMTIRGYVPIGEIRKGDLVLSHDGRFHVVMFVSRHPYKEKIVRLGVTGTNFEDNATHNHPYLTAKRNDEGDLDIAWRDAECLRRNDFILTPQLQHGSRNDIQKLDAWCYGLWLAQGSLQNAGHGTNRYPAFALDGAKPQLREKLEAWGGKANVKTYRRKSQRGITVMVFDPAKGERCFELCGKYADKKVIAPEVFQWSRELRQAFFEGYMAGDGCLISTRGHRHSKSVSLALASQMKFIAESLGYRTSLYKRKSPKDAGIGERKFKKTLPFYASNYHDRGRSFEQREVEFEGQKYWLRRIKKVDAKPYNGDVVNLNIEGSHTFQTAAGMSHNTMKPVEMLVYLIKNSSQRGEIVLDTFGGSGSTLIACEQTGRKCRMMELDEKYCDVIRRRWAEFVYAEGCDWIEKTPLAEVKELAIE